MQWTDIKITVPKAQADTAEAIATGVSGGGIYIEDYSDLEEQVERIAHVDLIEQDLLDKDRTHVTVHLYLSPDENPAEVLDLLRGRLEGAELDYSLAADGVEQQDWETAWKAYYHAMPIGKRLAIVPSWEDYPMFNWYQMRAEGKYYSGAAYAQHFLSMLSFIAGRPQAENALAWGQNFSAVLDYVEEHGVQVCGVLVYAEAPDLVQMWERGDIDGISISTVLPSRYSAEGGQYSW